MANIKSAKKRAKQTVVRNARNAAQRSMLRTAVKKVLKALDANDAAGAKAAFDVAQPILDRFSSRGLIHKNKAARHKSRLTARIKPLSAAAKGIRHRRRAERPLKKPRHERGFFVACEARDLRLHRRNRPPARGKRLRRQLRARLP